MFNQGLGKPQMTLEDRICDMMMQLDEHSDKIPEGMYLQFCDHLKVFHQNARMNQKHRQRLVAQEAREMLAREAAEVLAREEAALALEAVPDFVLDGRRRGRGGVVVVERLVTIGGVALGFMASWGWSKIGLKV